MLAAAAFASNPTLFNLLPGYLPKPKAGARIEKQKGFSVNSDAFMVSLIKAL